MTLALSNAIKHELAFLSPSHLNRNQGKLILITAIGTYALLHLSKLFEKRWGDSWRLHFGRLLLIIPFIRKTYEKDVIKNRLHFQEKVLKTWQKYGENLLEIPKKGWKADDIFTLFRKCCKLTEDGLKGKHFSGTIYRLETEITDSFIQFKQNFDFSKVKDVDFNQLSTFLHRLSTQIFDLFQLYNSLHFNEFPVGSWLEFQTISMISRLLGAAEGQFMGVMTDGGTGSLMLAMFAYRQRGRELNHIQPGEGVILASRTIHAAIDKAGQAFDIKIIHIDADESGTMDLEQLKKEAQQHKKNLLAIVASVPCYSTGQIDPIEDILQIAQESNSLVHLDYCLGSTVVPYYQKRKTCYAGHLQVGSFSFDPHKYGMTEKEVSAVAAIEEVAKYMIFAIPNWSGGPYGSIGFPGSKSCRKAASAFANLLVLGEEGYACIAQLIQERTQALADRLEKFKGQIKILTKEPINVVAFKVDPSLGLEKGATYALAYYMNKEGFVLNDIQGDAVHFCITLRFAADPEGLNKFEKALANSLQEIKTIDAKIKVLHKASPFFVTAFDQKLIHLSETITESIQSLTGFNMETQYPLALNQAKIQSSKVLSLLDEALNLLEKMEGFSTVSPEYLTKLTLFSKDLNQSREFFRGTEKMNQKEMSTFQALLKESLNSIQILQADFNQAAKGFPGEAAMYCNLDTALNPKKKELSSIDFALNYFFGILGAQDTIKAYFLAQMNPFKIKEDVLKEEEI